MKERIAADGRVLFVGPNRQKPGGVATFCRAVFPALRTPADYFSRGSATPASRSARLFKSAGDYVSFGRQVRGGRYRLVHLNLSISRVSVFRDRGFAEVAKRTGMALVLCIHGFNQRYFDATVHARRSGLRNLLSSAGRVFVVNRDAACSLEAAGFGSTVDVVSSVLESELVEGTDIDDLERARGRHPVILFLARLEPFKGVQETIEAFEIVKRRCSDAELLIAGEGSAADDVAASVSRRGLQGVSLVGHLDGEAKTAAFRRASVYVLPSFHDEGMPHSLIEAMAFGLPVVTRRVAGVRDFFVDGRMGFASETGAPEELADRLLALIENPLLSRRIGRHNFAFARREFSAVTVAARFDQAYRQLVGSAAG